MMRYKQYIITLALVASSATQWGTGLARDREPVVGGPCEGCEAVFIGMPESIGSRARIAPKGESGERMRIDGRVLQADGRPAPGVIVYAYHTDARGIYPRVEAMKGSAAYRHGRLRAWVVSDDDGHYRFDTIRPTSYPNSRIPQHVHMHVIEPGRCTYYIDSIHFRDDPFLAADDEEDGRGGPGVVTPRRDEDGVWHATRDIVLGMNVPGYPSPAR